MPLLKNPNAEWDRPALMTMGRGNHAVRYERYRFISYSDGSEELYDHEKDPWEWDNLASNPELRGKIAKLRSWIPKSEVPWQIDESKNWIYTKEIWDDIPVSEKK